MSSKNIFGQPLIPCSTQPMTGYFRNGCCDTEEADVGMHTVCAVMTDDFLNYSKEMGNDLSTPRPEWGFPGLKAGDKWCLCATRWVQAHTDGKAPHVFLEATNEVTLELIDIETLIKFAHKTSILTP
jgi:uncharacterized protein (DUF2237 family)